MDTSIWSAILQASLIVQLILLGLVGMSVFCWAVAIAKFRQFRDLGAANTRFLDAFWKTTSFDALFEDRHQFPRSSLAQVFAAGFLELQKLAIGHQNPLKSLAGQDPSSGKSPGDQQPGILQLSGIDNLERTLKKAMDLEIQNLESRLTWLATTGSTGPFVGLLGTVWGIMGSFHKIGAMGSASLAVVAPGISEALFATAIGLAAAIPAVVLYNHFITRVRKEEIELSNFMTDFLNIAKRNFFRS